MPTTPPMGTAESRRSPPVQPRSTTGNDLGNAAASWRTLRRFGSASGPQFGQKFVRLLLFNGVGVCQHLAERFVRQWSFGSCREQIKDEGCESPSARPTELGRYSLSERRSIWRVLPHVSRRKCSCLRRRQRPRLRQTQPRSAGCRFV